MSDTTLRQYDLLPQIAPFLDLHLLLPLLLHIEKHEIYPRNEILQAKLDLLSKTNMVDYAMDIYKELHNLTSDPEEMVASRTALLDKLNAVTKNSSKFSSLIEDKEVAKKLVDNNNFNAQYLEEHHKITKEDVEALYTLAKFQYECGKYENASENLHNYRALNTDLHKDLSALWGKLASEILMSDWEEAERDSAKIRELIEDPRLNLSPLKQLQDRVWLLHWNLSIYFNLPNGLVQMLDLYLGNERYLKAIEIRAPWILRYLTIAAIITKHRIKDLVKVVDQETYSFTDPITEFLRYLYVKFDFDSAEKELVRCEPILAIDYFVSGTEELQSKSLKDEFLSAARLAISEAFCRIHSTIDIGMMATRLGKTNEESERWIVNLLRNAKLDAKIDSAKNQVIVSSQAPNIYQQLQDRTNTLSLRAVFLASNLERARQTGANTSHYNSKKDDSE